MKERETVDKVCRGCNKTFAADLREHKRGYAHFCTSTCSAVYFGKKRKEETAQRFPNTICATCAKTFWRAPSKQKLAKSGFQFCSRVCKENAQRIDSDLMIAEIQPTHYKTGASAYRAKAIRLHGAICNRCGYCKYEKLLDVHHKDRNRENVSGSNLEVLCVRCHLEDHYENRDGPYTGLNIQKFGEVAQLGERLPCKQEVAGSFPVFSTNTVRQ